MSLKQRQLRTLYRVVRAYVDPRKLLLAVWETPRFLVEFVQYRRASNEAVPVGEIYPCLLDRRTYAASLDPHYFQQDLYVAEKIISSHPAIHVDVGSRVDGFVAQLSLVVPVEFVDVRPLSVLRENFRYRQGSLYALPYVDRSVGSLSCLHVVEHVGLGRYGDKLDPCGPLRALSELQRVLKVDGTLYISVPIGRPRVLFNSHRVFPPGFVIENLPELTLKSFAGIDDEGVFHEGADPQSFRKDEYALGIYEFWRKRIQ